MNNIWRKNLYHGVIDSYIKMPGSSKIKGTLLEINENKIKVSISKERTLDITLDKPIDAQVGDDMIIDRRNIVESKLTKEIDQTLKEEQEVQGPQNKYDYILKSLDIPINDESIEAIESLEIYGVDLTKENILSFISAKVQLSNISQNLDYDIAVKLVEKDIDFEKESLQKVVQEMQKVQGQKGSFSLLRFLGIKKDMTTEEAEKIAYELYGNRTGKDITDIIKALDRAGLDTSKKNIEEINNVFSKLHNIKNIENKTIIDGVKNKIEASIDNLYKLKNAVVKGVIKAEYNIGQLASRVYNAYSGTAGIITEKELVQMEGDIKNRLADMGIRTTDEIIRLSKDTIERGLDLTKENLHKIMSIKGAIVELNASLDYERTAILMASGIEVDKLEIRDLAYMVNDIEHMEDAGNNIEHVENTDNNIEHMGNIDNNIEHVENTDNNIEHMEHIPAKETSQAGIVMKNLSQGEVVQGKAKQGFNLELEGISEYIPEEGNTLSNLSQLKIEQDTATDLNRLETEQDIATGLDRLEVLELIENIDIKTLAFHMKLDLPNTLDNLNLSQQLIDGEITVDEWINTLEQNMDQVHMAHMQSAEISSRAEAEVNETEINQIEVIEAEVNEIEVVETEVIETESDLDETLQTESILIRNETGQVQQREGSTKNQEGQSIEGEIDPIGGETEQGEGAVEIQNNQSDTVVKKLVIDRTELLGTLNRLTNTEMRGLDLIAQAYVRSNGDKLGPLAEENYKNEMAKVIIQAGIPLNNNNMQELYMLKRVLERTGEGLTNNVLQNAAAQDILIDKVDLNELSGTITLLDKNVEKQDTRSIAKLESDQNPKQEKIGGSISTGEKRIATEKTIDIVNKMKDMVDLLKGIPEERKNTIISLLMKNAMPLTLKEVQNLSFFLDNQRQIGHQVDEILKLISKYDNTEIMVVAEDLKKAVNKANEHIRKGIQIEEKPYQELSRLLRELESKSSSLTGEDRNNLRQSGKKLLDSLELQFQLNREDTVLQLPLMMGEQLKNLQIYIMRDKKGSRKIDPKNMSVLLNFDTNNMGNVSIYLAVNYKNIVMKMGLSREEDQKLIEKYSNELQQHLEDLGYDLKELSFRLNDDNHILSMADEIETKSPKVKRLLDVMI